MGLWTLSRAHNNFINHNTGYKQYELSHEYLFQIFLILSFIII